MAQRIFDLDNPQDVKDLFDILPDDVKKIRWLPDDTAGIIDKYGIMTPAYFILIEWRDKTEISRPVDESKWIGCLCWFWDGSPKDKQVGFLKEIDTSYFEPYEKVSGYRFQNCRPARRDEIKFVEDVK